MSFKLAWPGLVLVGLSLALTIFILHVGDSENYTRAIDINYLATSDVDEDVTDILNKNFTASQRHAILPYDEVIWLRIKIPAEIRQWVDGAVLYTGSNEAMQSMQAYLVTNDKVLDLGYCDASLENPTCALPSLQYAFPLKPANIDEHTDLYVKILPNTVEIRNEFFFMKPGYFSKNTVFIDIFVGAACSFSLLICLLSIIFFISLKDYSFLAYGLLYLSGFVTVLLNKGVWDLVRPPDWIQASTLALSSILIYYFFDLLFIKIFFKIHQKNKIFNALTHLLMGALCIMIGISFFFDNKVMLWKIFPFWILTVHLFEATMLIYFVIIKRNLALPFFIAWFFSIFFTFTFILFRAGVIDGHWFYGYLAIFGRLLEGLVLNFVLYEKLKFIVTQIFKNNAKIEEMHVVKTLLRTLSHDLANTTQVIQLGAQVSLTSENPSQINKNLEGILFAAKAQSQIIDKAKDRYLARGGLIINLEKVDVKKCIQEAVAIFAHRLENKSISLVQQLPARDLFILAEATSFTHQVLANLLSNSIKFTPQGKSIYLKVNELASEFVEITIADEGRGIAEETREQIFNSSAISHLGTDKEEGSGHGLIIVREFLKAYGATIQINSLKNQGTEIILKFNKASA